MADLTPKELHQIYRALLNVNFEEKTSLMHKLVSLQLPDVLRPRVAAGKCLALFEPDWTPDGWAHYMKNKADEQARENLMFVPFRTLVYTQNTNDNQQQRQAWQEAGLKVGASLSWSAMAFRMRWDGSAGRVITDFIPRGMEYQMRSKDYHVVFVREPKL